LIDRLHSFRSARRGRRVAGTIVAVAVLGSVAASGPALGGDEDLFYLVRGGEVVFTNTPSSGEVRAVPGMAASSTETGPDLPATPFDPYIDQVARLTGLSPSLIKAVALVESGFDPAAVSSKGAQGLMQLMPGTAARYGVRDAFDPGENLLAGARHLRGLLDEFDGDLTLALAAYNAGAAAVRKHGGVPAYRETREYVRKVHRKLGREPRGLPSAAGESARGEPVRLVRREDGTVLLVN
jgi:hypothetical protein